MPDSINTPYIIITQPASSSRVELQHRAVISFAPFSRGESRRSLQIKCIMLQITHVCVTSRDSLLFLTKYLITVSNLELCWGERVRWIGGKQRNEIPTVIVFSVNDVYSCREWFDFNIWFLIRCLREKSSYKNALGGGCNDLYVSTTRMRRERCGGEYQWNRLNALLEELHALEVDFCAQARWDYWN